MRYEDCERADGYCEFCGKAFSSRTDCRNNVINRITYYRQLAGLSIEELAERAGLGVKRIEKFEYGVSEYRTCLVHVGVRIADALGVHPRELIDPDSRMKLENNPNWE